MTRSLLESKSGQAALEALCKPDNLSPEVTLKLVTAVQDQAGRARRHGLFDRIDEILAEGDQP